MTTPNPTVHLARITLNPRSRDVHHDLRDHTALHRRVSALFPDQGGNSPRTVHNVLYRLERELSGASLLVQSTAITVNRNALPANYMANGIDYRELTPLLDWATPGRTVRYRIDAHPLKTEFVRGQRGRRVSLTGEAALTWWERKAADAGLTPHLVLDTPQPPVLATRGEKKRAHLAVTRFDGIATVTDPGALRQAITTGIGQGRAFGVGLLSIAPHR